MKTHTSWFQRLAMVSMVGLLLQIIAPSITIAAPLGNLRTWENTITHNSASLGFSFSAAGDFKMEYGTSPGSYPQYSTPVTLTNTSYPNYSISISNLTSSTTYYYRLGTRPLNQYSTPWEYTGEASFTTTAVPTDTYPPASFTPSIGSAGADSISLTWTAPSDPTATGGTQSASSYEIRYKNTWFSSETDWSTATVASATMPTPKAPGGIESVSVGGLTSGTYYCFVVRARDNANNISPISSPACMSTTAVTDSTPPNQISSFTATPLSSSSATLSWTSPTDYGINGAIQDASRYEVRYRTSMISTETDWSSATSVTGLSSPRPRGQSETFTVSGLSPSTTYYFAIRSYDAANNVSPMANWLMTTMATTTTTTANPVVDIKIDSSDTTITRTAPANYTLSWTSSNVTSCTATGTWGPVTKSTSGSQSFGSVTVVGTNTYGLSCTGTNGTTVSDTVYVNITSSTTTTTTALAISNVSSGAYTSTTASIFATVNQSAYLSVRYGTGGTFSNTSSEIIAYPNVSSTIYLNALSPLTTYSYYVVARDSTTGTTVQSSNNTFVTATSSTTTTATTLPAGTSSLRVTVRGGSTNQLISGAMLGLNTTPPGSTTSTGAWASGTTGADGTYVFTGIAAGIYYLGASAPAGRTELGYISSQSVTLAPSLQTELAVSLPATSSTTTTGSGSIRVTVKSSDGPIVSGASISLNASTGGSNSRTGTSGSDGSFLFSALPWGSYYLNAGPPSGRTDLGSVSQTATISSNTTFEQPMYLPRTGSTTTTSTIPYGNSGVRVVVRSVIDNSLISGATVGLSNYSSTSGTTSGGIASAWANGNTGIDGSYQFSNIAPGSYNIGVSAPGRPELGYISSYPVTLSEGVTNSVEVTLPRSTTTTQPTPYPTTQANAAPVISGVHVMYNTPASTQIMWGTDKMALGKVDYGDTSAYGQSTTWTTNQSYSATVDIYGLQQGKTYHYRATAKNDFGEVNSSDYTFVAGSGGTGDSTTTFYGVLTVDSTRTNPQQGAYNVVLDLSKIHIEFTKSVDPASINSSNIRLTYLGSTATQSSISGRFDVFGNGFNYIMDEKLKPGITYNLVISGNVKDTNGQVLGSDYSLTFTTTKETTTSGSGTIKGVVKDGTGQTVAGAYVTVRNYNYTISQNIQTTSYGEYIATNLAPGSYVIEVYPPASSGNLTKPQPQNTTLAANETIVKDFVFASASKTIKGTVRFSDGSPVMDAEVSAYRRDGNGWISTPTTPAGDFVLNVGPGTWMVSIRPQMAPIPYATTPYGSTTAYPVPVPSITASWVYTKPPQEVFISTEPGSDAKQIEFIISRESSMTTVFGMIRRSDDSPIAAGLANIRFVGTTGISISTTVTVGGKFSTSLPPGGYKVYIDISDSDLSSPDAPYISIASGEQKDIGVITLYAASSGIKGRVASFDGKPIPRIKIGGWKMNSSDNSNTVTDENGNYVLKVSPGDWSVGIMPSPDQPYTTTVPPQLVRVVPGKTPPVNFVLATSDSGLNGTVKNGNGDVLSDFYGFISLANKSGQRIPGGAPVERGAFTLRLPAGTYMLNVELPPNSKYRPGKPTVITIVPGEQQSVSLVVQDQQSVSAIIGYLVDTNGNKITNVPFKVFATGEFGGWYSAEVDTALGYYKLNVPQGVWFVGYDIADPEGGYSAIRGEKRKIKLGIGQIESLNLEAVKSIGKIAGTTKDAQGKVVSNVWVAISSKNFSEFSRSTASTIRYMNGAMTDDSGQFSFNVPTGTYYVRAFIPPSFGLINPEEQQVAVRGGDQAEVNLVFRTIETTISGKATIAGIPSWAFVWAWSDSGGYAETQADDDGSYSLRVASGDVWHVSAMAELKRETFKASEVEVEIEEPGDIEINIDLAPLGVKLPPPVTITTPPDQMSVATNEEGARLVVPANATQSEVPLNISITPQVFTPSQGAERVVGVGYELEVRTQTGQEINAFNSELTISIPYEPAELTNLNLRPADLSLRYWNEASSTWQEVNNAVVDETNHVITASVAHLTRFAIIASTDTTPPSSPTKLRAKQAGDGIVLTWAKPKDKDFKYVKIYRSAEEGILGDAVANNITSSTFKDSGMAKGKRYFYVARAVDNSNNESTNGDQVSVLIGGRGVLGKSLIKKTVAAQKTEAIVIKGTIRDVNVVAGSMEIEQTNKKKVVVALNADTKITKDGKKATIADLKAGNSIEAQAAKDNSGITITSAKVKSVKLKIKASLEDSQSQGSKGKVKVKVKSTTGKVKGFQIRRGQEATLNVTGETVMVNGKKVPIELIDLSDNATIEGVLENGGITVKSITSSK